jgi:hypothetical protein
MKILDTGACPGPDPGFTGETTFYETIIRNITTKNFILTGRS